MLARFLVPSREEFSTKELEDLRARLDRLSQQKAHLQATVEILTHVTGASGLQNVLLQAVDTIMNILGGAEIVLYHLAFGQWFATSALERETRAVETLPPEVARCFASGQASYLKRPFAAGDPSLFAHEPAQTSDWHLPLVAGEITIGVLRIEGIFFDSIPGNRQQLEIIARYVAMAVQSEILAESRLHGAYKDLQRKTEELSEEIARRERLEKERERLEQHLLQSQKMEALGTLAGGIAHDFNNVLMAILGNLDIVQEITCPGDCPARARVNAAVAAAERAVDLVRRILSFARKEKGEFVVKEPVDLVEDSLKLIRPLLPENIAVVTRLDPACGTISVNVTQIEQVLLNLATNAAHAMEPDGGTLTIAVEPWRGNPNQSRPCIELSVSDTGCGVSPENLSRVFDPYFTTKGAGKGTGLGLAIVQSIMRNHEGWSHIESTRGKGTRVSCVLPVHAAVPADAAPAAQSAEPAKPCKEHILIVDDDVMVAQVTEQVVARFGYRTTVAGSASEALAQLEKPHQDFALVLTDQNMPGTTGLELARHVKAAFPRLPVLLCTGYRESLTDLAEVEKLVHAVLAKPYRQADLATAIRGAIESAARNDLQAGP